MHFESHVRWTIPILVTVLALQPGCRSCSRDRSRPLEQHAEPTPSPSSEADATPEAAENIAATDAAPLAPGAPVSPNVQSAEADAILRQLADPRVSIESISGPPTDNAAYHTAMESAARDYVHCVAVRDPSICDRLDPRRREKCRLEPSQVAARAQRDHGWVMTTPGLAWCHGGHLEDAQCAQYGEAVESHQPEHCAGLPDEAERYCRAMASGDTHNCDALPREVSCPREVQFYDQLRGGIDVLRQHADEYYRAYVVGLDPSPQACANFVRPRVVQALSASRSGP